MDKNNLSGRWSGKYDKKSSQSPFALTLIADVHQQEAKFLDEKSQIHCLPPMQRVKERLEVKTIHTFSSNMDHQSSHDLESRNVHLTGDQSRSVDKCNAQRFTKP